jgi:signal transduction histidine kinase
MLINMDVNNPPTPKLRKLVQLYREYDRTNAPIPIRVVGANDPTGWVHYGPSPLQRELRFMPFVMLGIFLAFMAVAIQGSRTLKVAEQRSIWVGMAKETAHQLGTPLSAMLGWVQVLKDRAAERGYDDMRASIDEMEVDLLRLNKVTERFSKIGSTPELAAVALTPVLERTVAYFQKRLPSLKANSSIALHAGEIPPVNGNAELLEWVFENLIKNAVDALGESGGEIEIERGTRRSSGVEVAVRDTGRGSRGRCATGSSTRLHHQAPRVGSRLVLARRIVEEYHNGSIRLAESRPGKGSTFLVRLPAATPDR